MKKIIKIKDCTDCPYLWTPNSLQRAIRTVNNKPVPLICRYSNHTHYTTDEFLSDENITKEDIINHYMKECQLKNSKNGKIIVIENCIKCPYLYQDKEGYEAYKCKKLDSIFQECPLEEYEEK